VTATYSENKQSLKQQSKNTVIVIKSIKLNIKEVAQNAWLCFE
jgi:hypothetical protein